MGCAWYLVRIMSSELSLQTPPKLTGEGGGSVAPCSPLLRVLIRHNFAVFLSFLDIKCILRLLSTQKFGPADRALVVAAILDIVVRSMPELQLSSWQTALRRVEERHVIAMIRNAYESFTKDRGAGMSRNLSHVSSHAFVHQWLDENDPRTLGDLIMSGYLSSRAKRADLLSLLERRADETQGMLDGLDFGLPQHDASRGYNERKVKAYRMLIDMVRNSFALELTTVEGRAWGNTGMVHVPRNPRLYVTVCREYVANLNRSASDDVLFRPFEYDLLSDAVLDEDRRPFRGPFLSPPLTPRPWHGPDVPRL